MTQFLTLDLTELETLATTPITIEETLAAFTADPKSLNFFTVNIPGTIESIAHGNPANTEFIPQTYGIRFLSATFGHTFTFTFITADETPRKDARIHRYHAKSAYGSAEFRINFVIAN